jgi:hypothetical protein
MANVTRGIIPTLMARFAGRLRFPQLFAFTGTLFLLDLLIPDLIPFADEMMLGLLTLMLGTWKKRVPDEPPQGPKPPIKDITPED